MKRAGVTSDALASAAPGGAIPEVDAEAQKRQVAEATRRMEEAKAQAESNRKDEVSDAVSQARNILGGK